MKPAVIASVLILILASLTNAGDDRWKNYNKPLTVDEISYSDWRQNQNLSERTISMNAHTPTVNYSANCTESIDTNGKRVLMCPSIDVDETYPVNVENGAICFIPSDKERDNSKAPFWACYSITKASRRSSK